MGVGFGCVGLSFGWWSWVCSLGEGVGVSRLGGVFVGSLVGVMVILKVFWGEFNGLGFG